MKGGAESVCKSGDLVGILTGEEAIATAVVKASDEGGKCLIKGGGVGLWLESQDSAGALQRREMKQGLVIGVAHVGAG